MHRISALVLKRVIAPGLAIAAISAATPAYAADITLTVTGAPLTIAQGGVSGPFTVNIAVAGNINLTHIPAKLTVQTGYYVNGAYYGTPSDHFFTAPATIADGCEVHTNGPNAGSCKATQTALLAPGSVAQLSAYLSAPAGLTPGLYNVCIAAAVTDGLSLTTLPCFDVEVTLASSKPTVTIIEPNNHTYNFGATVNVSVDVVSATALSSVTGAVNSGSPSALSVNSEEPTNYLGTFRADQPCGNTFTAAAANVAGTTTVQSTFTVNVPFGSWLPPITTAKFQAGRTLPVKFTFNEDNGSGQLVPSSQFSPGVYLNGQYLGDASLFYDVNGSPFYQYEIVLPKTLTGTAIVEVKAANCTGSAQSKTIQIK